MPRNLRKLDDEVWKELTFTDIKYEVSNYGRVRSYCYNPKIPRILSPSKIGGFNVVSMRCESKSKHFLIHKLVAQLFVEKTNVEQTVVIHLDWNKLNNHSSNLQWVTKKESYKRMHDRFKEDRKLRGKVITYSKLKAEEVSLLKSMLERGVKQNIIAKMFCVSEMQITRIKRGENWGDVSSIKQSDISKNKTVKV